MKKILIFFGSLLGGSKIVNVKGNVFGSGGLYDFKVIITTGDDYSNVLSHTTGL